MSTKRFFYIDHKYFMDEVNYKDGEPDFSDISKGPVEIKPFSDNRADNFDKAEYRTLYTSMLLD
jgi:hypothetical protein